MENLENLQQQIHELQKRNKLVEANKTWETSLFRKLLVASLTYFVIVVFFIVVDFPKPFVNAIVPTLGFLLSTLTVPIFKKWWLKKNNLI